MTRSPVTTRPPAGNGPTSVRRIARRGPGRVRPIARPGERRAARRRFSPIRAGAALVMILSLLGIWGLAASPAFAYRELRIDGGERTLTQRSAVEAAVAGVGGASNVFLIRTDRIAEALDRLPAVASADVAVGLPGTLQVRLDERTPVVAWVVGDRRFAVDADGLILAAFPTALPGPTASLVEVDDRRTAAASLDVGVRLDPVILDAATRLGSLRPSDVGSARSRLRISLDDADGFTLQPLPTGPIAVFGFYTASLRTPDLIPGQVRLLRSLMLGREATLGRIVLASDTSGTYLPKGVSPGPMPSARPIPDPLASPGVDASAATSATTGG